MTAYSYPRELTGDLELRSRTLTEGSPGITPAFGTALAKAAAVCLEDQNHASPKTMALEGSVAAEARRNIVLMTDGRCSEPRLKVESTKSATMTFWGASPTVEHATVMTV